MAFNFRSDGTVISYVNLGDAEYWGSNDIKTGSIVVDNNLIGVAMSEIVLSGNQSGSLQGQMVADADQDFKFESNNVCRIGEWAYDALISADVAAFTTIYWNKEFNILVKDETTTEFISSITAGAPDWTNEGTYGTLTVVANVAVATTEWWQLKKNEHDANYTLWGSYSGTVSEAITESALLGGYQPSGKGITITFASVTTAVGGDRWEWYNIKADSSNNVDISAMVLPYVESKIKDLGQASFNMPLVQTKENANVVKAGAYVACKWNVRFMYSTGVSQGGGNQLQLGKLLFQFV
jgi:hypothetical protein